MTLPRREVLGLGAALAARLATAQSPARFEIGCATLAWNVRPDSFDNFELALKDLSELGYWSFETVSPMMEALDTKDALRPMIERYRIPMRSVYMDVDVLDPRARAANTDKVGRVAKLAQKYGANYIVMGVNPKPRGQAFNFNVNLPALVAGLNEFGRVAVASGLGAGLHPHTGTIVETTEEVYGVMRAVNPRYMGFCPDTGQLQKGGGDAAKIVKDLAPLVTHVHLKDYSGGKYRGGYCPLGMGVVDIAGILQTLEAAGKKPGIVHELDRGNAPMTARETAAFSKACLKRLGCLFTV